MGTSFNQIVLLCPQGTAYNSHSEECDASSRLECSDNEAEYEEGPESSDQDPDGDLCEPGARAKDGTQNDCSGFTLCTGKRMVSMRCPRDERFDESQRVCRPAAMVDC